MSWSFIDRGGYPKLREQSWQVFDAGREQGRIKCRGLAGRKAGEASRAPQLEGLSTRLPMALGITGGGRE